MKLYEINDEITDEQFQALTDLEIKREEKIENTALYIKQLRVLEAQIAREWTSNKQI